MAMIFFSLAPEIYATHVENTVIILNVARNQYVSLIDDAAYYLEHIVSIPFIKNERNAYVPKIKESNERGLGFNHWITEFINQGLIIPTNSPAKRIRPSAKIPGGLREYQWDTKTDWAPFKKTSYFSVLKALCTLIRVNRAIKKMACKDFLS